MSGNNAKTIRAVLMAYVEDGDVTIRWQPGAMDTPIHDAVRAEFKVWDADGIHVADLFTLKGADEFSIILEALGTNSADFVKQYGQPSYFTKIRVGRTSDGLKIRNVS